MAHIKEHNINSEYICNYCERKFLFLYKELKYFKLLLK